MPSSVERPEAAFAGAKRDLFYDDGSDWWWSSTGQIVRWAIFGSLFLLLVLYLVLGYIHAKRRIKKGLPPLAYHRWLLSKRERAPFEPQFDPRYGHPDPYYNPDYYGMHTFPPPVYDPNSAPPKYQPPEGASKVDPMQGRAEASNGPAAVGEPSPKYTAPPGPPPNLRPDHTGASGTSNNPYRL